MATCSVTTLETQACASGFAQLAETNPLVAMGIELELLYLISGSTLTIAQLEALACQNGFTQVAQDPVLGRAVQLQLLCEITGGV